jgi:hypothetical protein
LSEIKLDKGCEFYACGPFLIYLYRHATFQAGFTPVSTRIMDGANVRDGCRERLEDACELGSCHSRFFLDVEKREPDNHI